MKCINLLSVTCALLSFIPIMAQEKVPTQPQEALHDSIMLQEVVVTATRPLARISGDGIVTTVQGTALSELGTAKDVLGFIPGIISSNGGIEVFGKGMPLIYINGRRMRNSIELDQLKSEKIKEIKLINNPGARYGSEANAVIRITTIKELGSGFALDTKTTLGYHDYLYGKEQVNMNYRKEGFDLFGMFEYDHTRVKGSSTNVQNTWSRQYDITRLTLDSKGRSQLFEGQIGFNYTTKRGHSFGGYYQTIGKPGKTHSNSLSSLWSDDVELSSSVLNQHQKTNYYEHLADGYYSGTWGKWTADMTFDFLWRNNKNKQSVEETGGTSTLVPFDLRDKSNGRMLAGEFHLTRPMWKGNLNIGTEYTNSRRKDLFNGAESIIDDNDNLIKEYNAAFYAELMQRFGPVTVQLGLRYEHINSDYYEYGKKMDEQSRKYDELLPSVMLLIPVKQAMFQLGYSRKYSRPLYSQLSSTVTYVNQYIYETGNPLLKTSYNDNVSLNFRYKCFMLMAAYKHVKDQIITSCVAYDKDPSVTLFKKNNSANSLNNLQVMASVMPGFIGKVWYPVLSCGLVSQFYQIDYLGQSKSMNHPVAIVQYNNIFRLPKDYMLTANLRWRSKGDGENICMGQSWQIDLGASKTFNKHWDVKLSLNDLFNTARKTQFTIYSGVRDVHIEKNVNTRAIELSVSYKFNMDKSRYKGKGAGKAEKERL